MKAQGDTKLNALLLQLKPVVLHIGAVSFFINLLVMPVSIYSLQVFDRVMATNSLATLFWLTAVMLILFSVAGVLQSMRAIMLQRVSDWLYDETAKMLLPITLAQATHATGGKGAQSLRDASSLKQFLSGPALVTLMDAPWSVLYIAVLFIVHSLLGVLVSGGALCLLALAWLNEVMMHKPMKQAGMDQMRGMQELEFATRNADVIEAMGMAPTLIGRWRTLQRKVSDAQGQAGARASIIQGMTKFVRLTLQVFVTAVSAWLAIEGQVTMGAVIASSILASRALAPFEAAIGSWKSLGETRAAFQRIQQLLAFQSRSEGISLPVPQGAISVENLLYAAPGQNLPILKNVSFALQPGESLGIIGPSGAGKTTLARLLMGIWQANSGVVRLDHANVYTWPREEFGRYVGYLPQDVELFGGMVKDNIARMQPDATPEMIVEAAQMAGAHELILRLPKGYETEIGAGGAMLSAGQRQRIGLARAFYGRPKFLMLDEPDANLDEAGQQALMLALKQAKIQRITTIIITHRGGILSHLDKLLLLSNGSVEAFGPTQQVWAALNKNQQALAQLQQTERA